MQALKAQGRKASIGEDGEEAEDEEEALNNRSKCSYANWS